MTHASRPLISLNLFEEPLAVTKTANELQVCYIRTIIDLTLPSTSTSRSVWHTVDCVTYLDITRYRESANRKRPTIWGPIA